MKKLLTLLAVILLTIVISASGFYFWASSPGLDVSEYAQLKNLSLAKESPDSTWTIVTYNIGYLSGMTNNLPYRKNQKFFEENMSQVVKALGSHSIDILALQEIDFHANRSYFVKQDEVLMQQLSLPQGALAVNWDKNYVPFPYFPFEVHFGRLVSGQAILSNNPIKEQKRIVLERPYKHPFYYDAFYIDRLAQVCTVQLNGEEVIVMNIHLEAFDQETRRRQSKYVLDLYKKYQDKPVLLVGDFNSDPHQSENPTITLFLQEAGLKSAVPVEASKNLNLCTYPSDNPNEHIDFIFYNQYIQALDWKVLKGTHTASDHLPVLMNFRLNNNKALSQIHNESRL
ncbi:endonuclease/exonuclease/phosphatase family protein [Rapidithrix thailandica]|uniref:Endonuclease/exonuclease/phosphatase family protein n=1 Tax=Rapidithrix thailandica TaxID=413964 RepID=A0AAW9SA64_9BACT